MGILNLFNEDKKKSLDRGLKKSKENFFGKLGRAVVGKSTIDDEILDELEEILITSDVGIDTTVRIIERIEKRVSKEKYMNAKELDVILREEIGKLLAENNTLIQENFELPNIEEPYVILVVGVNGVGKTTTVGKLAAQYNNLGKKVILGAADTFRAAAVDQLMMWGKRIGVDVVSKGMNTDPSAVAFEAVKRGVEDKADIVIIDTAGRLHTKVNLMNELTKIENVIKKFILKAPHDVMLVLDGSTGQNAFIQAQEFTKATNVSSLAITKLDGTAKGGVVIGISDQFKIPVKYIGVGEQIEDLQVFNRMEYVDSFFSRASHP